MIAHDKRQENQDIIISIITATYNAEAFLENLIRSIIPQLTEKVEFIIIDGGSSDRTVEMIKNYESYISYWNSEPDQGIYDAWNKGLKVVKGQWVMFLGADDQLLPGALQSYLEFISKNAGDHDIICSKLNYTNKNGQHIRFVGEPWNWKKFKRGKMSFAHPGMLHNTGVFNKYGIFDTKYKICGDLDFLLRTKGNITAGFLDALTVKMQHGGISHSFKAITEAYQIRKKNETIPWGENMYLLIKIMILLNLSRFKNILLLRGRNEG